MIRLTLFLGVGIVVPAPVPLLFPLRAASLPAPLLVPQSRSSNLAVDGWDVQPPTALAVPLHPQWEAESSPLGVRSPGRKPPFSDDHEDDLVDRRRLRMPLAARWVGRSRQSLTMHEDAGFDSTSVVGSRSRWTASATDHSEGQDPQGRKEAKPTYRHITATDVHDRGSFWYTERPTLFN